MPPAEHQRHARDRGPGAGQEHGLLARALGAAVHAPGARRIALAEVGPLAGEDQVGRECDEAEASFSAARSHEAGQPRVHPFGFVRAGLAVLGATQHRRVDDGLGPGVVEEPRNRRGVRQVGQEGPRPGRGSAAAVGRRDVEAPLMKQGRETPAEEPPGTGDQDAQRRPQPVITAPPLTDRTWPWR